MKIAISGSSGFIGSSLSKMFMDRGDEVIRIERKDLYGDYIHELAAKLVGVEVIVNLAGATINHQWSKTYKNLIIESRLISTQKIVDVINHMRDKPKIFVSASAIGYYSSKSFNDEQGAKGDTFLSYVCDKWEDIARGVDSSVRTVIMRMGVVVSDVGGAYKMLFNLASRYHVVVKVGSGEEVISWIELSDLLRLYLFVIENSNINGIVNCVAPIPFTGDTIAKLFSAKFNALIVVIPRKFVEIAMGERSEVLLNGSSVYPNVVLINGFVFRYNNIMEYISSL